VPLDVPADAVRVAPPDDSRVLGSRDGAFRGNGGCSLELIVKRNVSESGNQSVPFALEEDATRCFI
jgi:hypothetical protein